MSVEEFFAAYFRPNGTFAAAAERLKIMNQNCLKRSSSYSGSYDPFKNRHLSQLLIVDLNSSSTLVRGLNFGKQLNLSEIYHCWIWNKCLLLGRVFWSNRGFVMQDGKLTWENKFLILIWFKRLNLSLPPSATHSLSLTSRHSLSLTPSVTENKHTPSHSRKPLRWLCPSAGHKKSSVCRLQKISRAQPPRALAFRIFQESN